MPEVTAVWASPIIRPEITERSSTPGVQPATSSIAGWRATATRRSGASSSSSRRRASPCCSSCSWESRRFPCPPAARHTYSRVAMLLAVQLIAGRDQIWLPARWRRLRLAGPSQQRFINRLMKTIRWLERFSHPRASYLFDHRLSNIVFGVLVLAGSLAAFLAPPFTGLDTLPSLGVVLLSIAVLLEDLAIVVLAVAVGVAGVALELILGRAVVRGIGNLF